MNSTKAPLSTRTVTALFLLLLGFTFMYKETPAQAKTVKAANTKPTQTAVEVPEIAYTVSMSKPATHLLEVEMRLNWKQMPDQAELKMPVWTPGSYLVREYATRPGFFSKGRDG